MIGEIWAMWLLQTDHGSQVSMLLSLANPGSLAALSSQGLVNLFRTIWTDDKEGREIVQGKIRVLASPKGIWTGSPQMIPTPLKQHPFSSICLFYSPQDMFWSPRASAGHDLKTTYLIPFYRKKKIEGPERESGSPKVTQHSPSSHSQFLECAYASLMSLFPTGSVASPLPSLAERICQLSACLSN